MRACPERPCADRRRPERPSAGQRAPGRGRDARVRSGRRGRGRRGGRRWPPRSRPPSSSWTSTCRAWTASRPAAGSPPTSGHGGSAAVDVRGRRPARAGRHRAGPSATCTRRTSARACCGPSGSATRTRPDRGRAPPPGADVQRPSSSGTTPETRVPAAGVESTCTVPPMRRRSLAVHEAVAAARDAVGVEATTVVGERRAPGGHAVAVRPAFERDGHRRVLAGVLGRVLQCLQAAEVDGGLDVLGEPPDVPGGDDRHRQGGRGRRLEAATRPRSISTGG